MGKRSEFERIEKDFYATIDKRAALALAPHINPDWTYAEPCNGAGDLQRMLADIHLQCEYEGDISTGQNALELSEDDLEACDYIITNPPWSRVLLHSMIIHFQSLRPTWLLFDADWCHTKQSIPYMEFCTDIVSVGRLIWIPGTTMSGKDNCAWYRFSADKSGPTKFHGRSNPTHTL